MFQREAVTLSSCLRYPVFALTVLLLTPLVARAAEFTVTAMYDRPDDIPGDGICASTPDAGMPSACTLRAAIMEANALGGPERHVIHVPAGLYQLTYQSDGGILAGLNEDIRQTAGEGARPHDEWNDLDIGVDLEIVGAGEEATIIEGNGNDRVFHVLHRESPGSIPRFVGFADLTIRNGHTLQRGAGVFVEQVREAQFEDVTVADNRGTHFFRHDGVRYISMGGGIFSQAYDLFLTRVTLRNNFAVTGGGLAVAAGWATIRDTTVEGNEARHPGSDAPGLTGSRPGLGGGIALFATEQRPTFMWMTGSTLNDNRAYDGGGLAAWGGFSVVNSTFSDNTAEVRGGGAYVRTPIGARVSMFEFATIAGNTAGSGDGGGVYRETFSTHGRLFLARSIVANNTPENCAGAGRPMSNGHNLEDGTSCGFTWATDLPDTEPLLAPLHDNGGPTATRALLPLSPAANRAGTTGVRVDQRGVTRPQGSAMDIGAYEDAMPRLRVPFPIPRRFEGLFGFSVRVTLQGTSGAGLKEIVPAIDGLKLSIEIDKSGQSAIVSAPGLAIDVNALRKKTKQRQPALFYIGADDQQGSEFVVVSEQRFDASVVGVTKLPAGKK